MKKKERVIPLPVDSAVTAGGETIGIWVTGWETNRYNPRDSTTGISPGDISAPVEPKLSFLSSEHRVSLRITYKPCTARYRKFCSSRIPSSCTFVFAFFFGSIFISITMVLTLTMTFRKISDTFTMALRLLPASNAAAYAELVLASEASEGLVNGIWNS